MAKEKATKPNTETPENNESKTVKVRMLANSCGAEHQHLQGQIYDVGITRAQMYFDAKVAEIAEE